MLVLPALLSHQPPSLKRGYIARELETHVAPGQAGLPRGVPCPGNVRLQRDEGPRAKSQVGIFWETPPGSPLGVVRIPLGTSLREEQFAMNRGVAGGRGQAAQLFSDPPPPMQLLHSCIGTG